MRLVEDRITLTELRAIAGERFGDMVKAVVDVELGLLALDAELHSDLEALLLEAGSDQRNLWGINLYPDVAGDDWLEYDSLINLRPSQDNLTRGVNDPATRDAIAAVVNRRVTR